jgi:hypothetical protein
LLIIIISTRFPLDLTPEYEAILPPTDSRLRADRRALESGDLDKAAKMKHELEEAQRAAKRTREAKNESWTPRYFEVLPLSSLSFPSVVNEWLFEIEFLTNAGYGRTTFLLLYCIFNYLQKVDDPEYGYLWKFNGKYWEEHKQHSNSKTNHNTDSDMPQ